MELKYKFYIAGRTRNKEKILNICKIFEELNISHYCFLKNEQSHKEAGLDLSDKKLADKFENMDLQSDTVKTIFKHDKEQTKNPS